MPLTVGGALEEERRAQGDRQFRQEHHCEFVETAEVLFPMEWLDRAITDEVTT